jgi:single-stranded-DNA-specific exonuclease
MDHAMLSFRLLTSSSPSHARELAQQLEEKNRARREVTTQALHAARIQVEEQEGQPMLFAAGPNYHEGVLGLAAQRLCDDYYRPAVVSKHGEVESVSSARSVNEFDIIAALDECAPLLKRHGGHAKAAGFTVMSENLPHLRAKLRQIAAERLADVELRPTLDIDAELPVGELKPDLFHLLQRLEPLGAGNPEPMFLSHGTIVRDCRIVGDGHLKLSLSDGRFIWDAIAFGMGEHAPDNSSRVDVVYTPQVRMWRGNEQLQLRVADFRPSC